MVSMYHIIMSVTSQVKYCKTTFVEHSARSMQFSENYKLFRFCPVSFRTKTRHLPEVSCGRRPRESDAGGSDTLEVTLQNASEINR